MDAKAALLTQQKSIDLLNKIEKIDPEIYWRFLDAVELHRLGYLSADDLRIKVGSILSGHDDLHLEFLKEFSQGEEYQRKRQRLELKRAANFVNKILTLSLQHLSRHIFEMVEGEVVRYKKSGCSNQATLIDNLDAILCVSGTNIHEEFKQILLDSNLELPKRDYWRSIPTHEIDLSICEPVTQSYWLRPGEPSKSDEFLNDRCFSVGSIDPQRQYVHKERRHEEVMMFQRDDDMYEADMLLRRLDAAIGYTYDVLSLREEEANRPVGFDRLIRQLYEPYGEEVLQILKKNLRRALRVMLVSFEKKKAQLLKEREVWSEIWRNICGEASKKSGEKSRDKLNR